MNFTVVVTPQAQRDIAGVVRISRRDFGHEAAIRYRDLIAIGIESLARNPKPTAGRSNPELKGGARTYHLRHVRQTARPRVGHPRHLLIYDIKGETVRVLRVLHDAMDLPRHVLKR